MASAPHGGLLVHVAAAEMKDLPEPGAEKKAAAKESVKTKAAKKKVKAKASKPKART